MRKLHLVSHTHWDREWYLTFQQFRLKLVRLVDKLLSILESDPDYRHFMLDGQTIVLDDYLYMRPENAATLRQYVQEGRLHIGPWHILPDEFLVSPEATIRNLLQGQRTSERFGPKMMVGYIPDPFGHIAQMPQILRGFDIQVAAFRRGLSTEPCELWWQAPDGSRLLTAYLRDGYDNAAWSDPAQPEKFLEDIRRLRDSLLPHTACTHLLLMNGTDHMEPHPETSRAVAYVNAHLENDRLVHSTLPEYFAAIQAEIDEDQIPTVFGELRDPQRHHLLPGVLSTRMWIKQRNHACETLLEKWAEPFSAFASLLEGGPQTAGAPSTRLGNPAPILRQAWRMLMENHPHDSICGCSIDQVHTEMRPRFDQVEQVGEEITRQSLEAIAAQIDTRSPGSGPQMGEPRSAIVVFNPTAGPRSDVVHARIKIPAGVDAFEIVDAGGQRLPHSLLSSQQAGIGTMPLDREGLQLLNTALETGMYGDMAIVDLGFRRQGDTLLIDVILVRHGKPALRRLQQKSDELMAVLADQSLVHFLVRAREPRETTIQFVAPELPGFGYGVFWLRPSAQAASEPEAAAQTIENEFFRVEAQPQDGTLTITDRWSGAIFSGLNRFVDGGDAGDSYNYSPPAYDTLISHEQGSVLGVRIERLSGVETLEIRLELPIPASLSEDRQRRAPQNVPLYITTRASVYPGVPRVDIETRVDNRAADHRLRVHFPAPFRATHAHSDAHFFVQPRSLELPKAGSGWVEQPRPEIPQRAFSDLSDGKTGLMIANRGLPEVAMLPIEGAGAEIALTLLRCIGWLSRDDFSTRVDHAGPMLPTPGAQEIGKHTFEYAILPHTGDWQAACQQAYAYQAPLRAAGAELHPGSLPSRGYFIETAPASFVVSAVKQAEDGSGLIVRGYHLLDKPASVSLETWRPFRRAVRVNLAERELEELPLAPDGSLALLVEPHQIASVKFS
jgi:alpha-mannosidase